MKKTLFLLHGAGLAALGFTLVYGRAGMALIMLCALALAGSEYFWPSFNKRLLTPYTLMLFSPLVLVHYAFIVDFRIRVLCFVLLALIVTIPLQKAAGKTGPHPRVKKSPVIWLIAFILFSLFALHLYRQGIYLSGDEPHYLMISQSLVEDGDFDLKNQVEEKTYFKYLPLEIPVHGGEIQGKYRSFHLPGVSFLLVPFYWLFNLLGGAVPAALFFRLAAALINAFFALALFKVLKMCFPQQEISPFWLLFLFIFPLSFHAVHLYPELPAATLLMAGFILAFSENKHYFLSGLCLALIPWFHVKYAPGLALLAIVILVDRVKRKKFSQAFVFLLAPLVSLGLLILYSHILYGSFNPAQILPREGYFSVPLVARIRTLFAYFLDQRDGLLFYTPLLFLAFFGFKRKFPYRSLFAGLALIHILLHANTTVRGAYSPAGRPLMFIAWIPVILAVNYYFSLEEERKKYAFKILVGLSLFIQLWLLYYPLFVYQPVFSFTAERASGLLTFFGSSYISLASLFPSFLSTAKNWHYPANLFWIGLLALLLLVYYLHRHKVRPPALRLYRYEKPLISIVLFLVLSFPVCFYPHVHLLNQNKFAGESFGFFNNSRNFTYIEDRRLFRIKTGNRYDLFFDLKQTGDKRLRLDFPASQNIDIALWNGKERLFSSRPGENARYDLDLSSMKSLKVKNKLVAHLGFSIRARAAGTFVYLAITPAAPNAEKRLPEK